MGAKSKRIEIKNRRGRDLSAPDRPPRELDWDTWIANRLRCAFTRNIIEGISRVLSTPGRGDQLTNREVRAKKWLDRLEPELQSALRSVISSSTKLNVSLVVNGMALTKGHVYPTGLNLRLLTYQTCAVWWNDDVPVFRTWLSLSSQRGSFSSIAAGSACTVVESRARILDPMIAENLVLVPKWFPRILLTFRFAPNVGQTIGRYYREKPWKAHMRSAPFEAYL